MVRIARPAQFNPAQGLEQDWRVIAARAAEAAGLADLDRALRAAREQAIIEFGDTGLAGLGGFNLDPSVAALVAQNNAAGFSTSSRLKKSSDLRRRAIINQLAGSGMIFSGDTGYLSSEEDKLAGSELYDARQAVLAALRGVQQQDLSQRQGLRGGTVQALNEAYQHRIDHPELYAGTVQPLAATSPDYFDPDEFMPATPTAAAPLPNRPRVLARPRRAGPYRFRGTGRGF